MHDALAVCPDRGRAPHALVRGKAVRFDGAVLTVPGFDNKTPDDSRPLPRDVAVARRSRALVEAGREPEVVGHLAHARETFDVVDPRDDSLGRPSPHPRQSGSAGRFVPYLAGDRHEKLHARVRPRLRVEDPRDPPYQHVLVRQSLDELVSHEGVELVGEFHAAKPLDAGRTSARPTSGPDGPGRPSSRDSSARRSRAT